MDTPFRQNWTENCTIINFTVSLYNLPTIIFSSSTANTIETLRANLVNEGL